MAGGKCKVAWTTVCSPRDLGGLGIPDLRLLGFALRLRWEWLRRSRPEAVPSLLPSGTERIIQHMFCASVTVQVGDGACARF